MPIAGPKVIIKTTLCLISDKIANIQWRQAINDFIFKK